MRRRPRRRWAARAAGRVRVYAVPTALMQSITACASVIRAWATAGSTFGFAAVARALSVVWKSTSFWSASAFLSSLSFVAAVSKLCDQAVESFWFANVDCAATVSARSVASCAWHSSTAVADAELTAMLLSESSAASTTSRRVSFMSDPLWLVFLRRRASTDLIAAAVTTVAAFEPALCSRSGAL